MSLRRFVKEFGTYNDLLFSSALKADLLVNNYSISIIVDVMNDYMASLIGLKV